MKHRKRPGWTKKFSWIRIEIESIDLIDHCCLFMDFYYHRLRDDLYFLRIITYYIFVTTIQTINIVRVMIKVRKKKKQKKILRISFCVKKKKWWKRNPKVETGKQNLYRRQQQHFNNTLRTVGNWSHNNNNITSPVSVWHFRFFFCWSDWEINAHC